MANDSKIQELANQMTRMQTVNSQLDELSTRVQTFIEACMNGGVIASKDKFDHEPQTLVDALEVTTTTLRSSLEDK
jgi:hypothetical protein